MAKIGTCEKTENGWDIQREWYSQGWVFKDEDAFLYHHDRPCYVSELCDDVYTYNDLLEMCDCQSDIAEMMFNDLDWESPSTWIEDMECDGEIHKCENCGHMFLCYGLTECPHCGASYDEEEYSF